MNRTRRSPRLAIRSAATRCSNGWANKAKMRRYNAPWPCPCRSCCMKATARMNRGLSRVYQWHLLKSLKQGARRKAGKFDPPAPLEEINQMKGFFEFDDRVTARLHGFEGAMHYYTSSSSRQYLNRIRIRPLSCIPPTIRSCTRRSFPKPESYHRPSNSTCTVTAVMSGSSAATCPGSPTTGWMNEFPPGYANNSNERRMAEAVLVHLGIRASEQARSETHCYAALPFIHTTSSMHFMNDHLKLAEPSAPPVSSRPARLRRRRHQRFVRRRPLGVRRAGHKGVDLTALIKQAAGSPDRNA